MQFKIIIRLMKKNPTYLFLKLAQRYSLSSIMSPIVKMLIIVGGDIAI